MTASGSSDSRKYFLAAMVIVGIAAIVFGGIGALVTLALFKSTPVRLTGPFGDAHLAVHGPYSHHYALSATFDVPPPTERFHSEPSMQIDVITRGKRVEAGIIRSAQAQFALSGFYDSWTPGHTGKVVYFKPLSDGKHRVTLAVSDAQVTVSIDGVVVHSAQEPPLAQYVPRRIIVGTYVGARGELAEGSVEDLEVVRDANRDPRPQRVLNPCIYSTAGLLFVPTQGGWSLTGRNTRGATAPRDFC